MPEDRQNPIVLCVVLLSMALVYCAPPVALVLYALFWATKLS